MQYIRKKYRDIPINISTIAGVKSVINLEQYLDIRPSRVVVHHDLGKDWDNLKKIVRFGKRYDIQAELLVNESCLLHCPNRIRHYSHLAKKKCNEVDLPFMATCNAQKIRFPREFLLSGGLIRPEDLKIYEDMGITHFKISGRDKPAGWLPKVVTAYQKRIYQGNLVRLLDIAPSLKAEEWIFIDNNDLDGFLSGYPHKQSHEKQSIYCDKWIVELYKNGNFKVDKTSYEVADKSLVLKKAGPQVRSILDGIRSIR